MSFFKRLFSGWRIDCALGMNFVRNLTIPRNLQSSIMLDGGWSSWIADTFFGSILMPLELIIWPRNSISDWPKEHLPLFSYNPDFKV